MAPKPESVHAIIVHDCKALNTGRFWGATEQRKHLSVVTDASEGVYRPTIVLGSPTTASGRAVKRRASVLTPQMSHP
jgi:hypothetical protein